MLLPGIFSFAHSFQSVFHQGSSPKQTCAFTCLQYKSFENTMGKGEIACNEQFLLFPSVFYPFGEFSSISLDLTHYHPILTFDDPKEEGFGKHFGKMW